MLKENGGIFDQLTQLIDILLMGIGFFSIINLYEEKRFITSSVIPINYFIIFLTYLLFWSFATNIYRLYGTRWFISLEQEIKKLMKAQFLTFALTISVLLLYDPRLINNRFVFYFEGMVFFLMFVAHLLVRILIESRKRTGRSLRYVLLLGGGKPAKAYLNKIYHNPQLGYKVVGYLAPVKNGLEVPYFGDYSQLEGVLKANAVDMAVVTATISEQGMKECIRLLETMGKNIMVMVDDMISKVAHGRSMDFGGLSMVAFDSYPRRPWHQVSKRLLDFTLGALGLLAISPFLAAIALSVKLASKGPVIFSQERVGLNGRLFRMHKFRSMIQDAEDHKGELMHLNEMSGPVFKIKDDPRVNAVGRFLRKTSLDELPQLWNVLIGDMSLVGPRPPLPFEVNMYDAKHQKRLTVKPGITCIWQISGRNAVDFDQWMEMDADYIDHFSFWLDMEILAKTVPCVLMRKGAS